MKEDISSTPTIETNELDTRADAYETKPLTKKEMGDKLTKIALQQLGVSNKFKEPLIEKWNKYEDLKAGRVARKLRQQFNVVMPVFSGMLDSLAASYDEPIEVEIKHKHPADYFKAKKYHAAFEQEKQKNTPDALWDYKARIDRSINLMYGRSILKYYAYSDPKYHSVLTNVHPRYFHCQPKGGGILEKHLFAGEEGIYRTWGELKKGAKNGLYDKKQLQELRERAKNDEYLNQLSEHHREKMKRFESAGLNAEDNDFVGVETYNLCEWVLTHGGKRWYLLFDPWTSTWLRFEELKKMTESGLMPWASWASFEDDQLFWSMSYADILYPVADAVITLFNQELTNREKQNLNARAYDKDVFTDVGKLDAAQYKPDALVPADTKGGTRKIGDALYAFQTPELTGTISLLDWVNASIEKQSGITDISQGAAMDATKKVNVAYMEQAAVSKRIGYKSQSYTGCWGEIVLKYCYGLKEHLTEDMFIEMLGDTGIEPDVLTRDDLDTEKELGVLVISSKARQAENEKKKKGRVQGYSMLMQSQNVNSEWRDAGIMRDVMELSEEEIKLAMDTKNYAARESVAKAHLVIQELLAGETPMLNYASDAVFMKVILDYMMEHRNKLGIPKAKKFVTYLASVAQVANQNAKRQGTQTGQRNARIQAMNNATATTAPQGGSPMGASAQPAAAPEQAQGAFTQ